MEKLISNLTKSQKVVTKVFLAFRTTYSGTKSPLGHRYQRDTFVQGTQNLVLEKCSQYIIFIFVTSTEGTPSIQMKGTLFLGPETPV